MYSADGLVRCLKFGDRKDNQPFLQPNDEIDVYN